MTDDVNQKIKGVINQGEGVIEENIGKAEQQSSDVGTKVKGVYHEVKGKIEKNIGKMESNSSADNNDDDT